MRSDKPARWPAWLWYALPSLGVALVGLATCSLIDVTDFDTFQVETSVADRSGVRTAVVARQWHADSSAAVRCVWIIAGPAPGPGPSRRLAERCALIATDPRMPLDIRWQANGRLAVGVPGGTTFSAADLLAQRCYFDTEQLGAHVCYDGRVIDVVAK